MGIERDLRLLPKAHLHIHLEGAMRPSTLAELAAKDRREVPPTSGLSGFPAFADTYVSACEVLHTEARMRRLVHEVVEDAARDGVVWIEPAFYAPRYSATFGSAEAATEIVLDELANSGARLGVGTGLIASADRTVDPAEAVQLARMAVRLAGRGVVGFGLANEEARFPAKPFTDAFRIAVEGGLLSVPHGGEQLGPESVVSCVEDCWADRVMHGVRAVEDPELLTRLADEGVCLDVCPTSNVALAVYPSLDDHPLPELIKAGVMCSINADDPLLFGPGILDEYEVCRRELDLDDESLAQVAIWSFEASAAPGTVVKEHTASVEAWLEG
jgi:adenosine deaminase